MIVLRNDKFIVRLRLVELIIRLGDGLLNWSLVNDFGFIALLGRAASKLNLVVFVDVLAYGDGFRDGFSVDGVLIDHSVGDLGIDGGLLEAIGLIICGFELRRFHLGKFFIATGRLLHFHRL